MRVNFPHAIFKFSAGQKLDNLVHFWAKTIGFFNLVLRYLVPVRVPIVCIGRPERARSPLEHQDSSRRMNGKLLF